MSATTQVGWIDERGILFPLASYCPERASQYDAHKAGWKKVYTPSDGAELVAISTDAAGQFESLDAENHALRQQVKALTREAWTWNQALTEVTKQQVGQREALEFYANPSNWTSCSALERGPLIDEDEGDRARFALTASAPAQQAGQPATSNGYELGRSIIHECPALKMPQTLTEKVGATRRIIALKGATDEDARLILAALISPTHERAAPSQPVEPLPPAALAEARVFGAGLDADSLEQASEVS